MKVSFCLNSQECQLCFKTVAASPVVGVWWVNPIEPTQVLHLGQYHLQQDAWLDVGLGGQVYLSDEACLHSRPAVPLTVEDLPLIRAYLQQRFVRKSQKVA